MIFVVGLNFLHYYSMKVLFESVQNKLSIHKALFIIIEYRLQILILYIQKYFLTNFKYGITTSCVDNKIYIWCSSGCYGERHLGTERNPHKLRYLVKGICSWPRKTLDLSDRTYILSSLTSIIIALLINLLILSSKSLVLAVKSSFGSAQPNLKPLQANYDLLTMQLNLISYSC